MTFDERTVELIAIGASIAANCQPCLQYHINKALEVGITEQEIKEAVKVGRTVRKGAAYKMDQFTTSLSGESAAVSRRGGEGCGCGSS